MAIIAISLTLAGPRIGAGIGRIELNQAEQTVRSYIKLGRVQAQRSDRVHYVVLDRQKRSVVLVNTEMKVLREAELPSSVEFVLEPEVQLTAVSIAPSGIARGNPIRLRGRSAETEVPLR
jgi:type II secretory pathway pseudopilin PulG